MDASVAAKSSVNLRNILLLFAMSLCAMIVDSQKVTCRQRPMDLMFVIDGSRSVRPKNFRVVQDTVKKMVDSIQSIGPKNTQIGLIQYSSRVRMEFKLNQYQTKKEIKQGIDAMDYMEMGTMTGLALKFMLTEGFTDKGGSRMDPEVLKVAVVITDGRSQDSTVPVWQKKAMEDGIILYAIGVGRRVMQADLRQIASEPKDEHVYSVKNFNVLRNLDVMLAEEICDVDECEFGNHTCSQICINTETSFTCDCYEGYILQEDGSSCIKPDPCKKADCVYKCETLSHNGYRCLCPPGHRLNKDEISCDAPVPQNLVFSDVTHTSMRVTWELPSPDDSSAILHYQIFYIRKDGKGGPQTQLIKGDPTIVIKDLDPGTPYLVTVAAVSEHDFSEPVQGEQSTLFLGETRVDLTDPTITTLIARWQPAGGDLLSGYELQYKRVPDESGIGVTPGEEKVLFVGPDTNELRLDSLEPGTLYSARVTPLHGKLRGTPGEDREKTKNLAPPTVLIPQTSLSTAIVEWTDIGDKADYYMLSIYANDDPDEIESARSSGNVLLHTFRDLTPDTEYTVLVVGHVVENGKEFASPTGSATGRTKSLPPPKISITNTSLSTAEVVTTVSSLDVIPQYFTLTYCRTDNPDEMMINVEDLYVMLHDLRPDTEYMVKVVANVYDDDKLFSSLPGTDSARTKSLSRPDVDAIASSLTSASVQWGKVGLPADKFILKYNPRKNESDVEELQFAGDIFKTIIQNLQHGQDYVVMVIGYVIEDDKEFESPVGNSAVSLDTLDPPKVQITESTTRTLDARWMDGDSVERFIVTIKSVKPEYMETFTVDGKVTEKTFTMLVPATEYVITVLYEVMDNGNLIRSPIAEAVDVTLPEPPQNLQVQSAGPESIIVIFEPSEGGGDWFEAKCVPKGDDPGDYAPLTIENSNLTVHCMNLIPGITYEIQIVTIFRNIRSNRSSVLSAMTEVGPVLNFDLKEPTPHSLLATWEPPEGVGEPLYYEVTYSSIDLGTSARVRVPGAQTRVTLESLHPDTPYQAAVYAVVGDAVSPPASDTDTTLPDVIDLQVVDSGFDYISVEWPKSKVPEVTSYKLHYIPAQETESLPDNAHLLMTATVGPNTTTYVIMKAIPATKYLLTLYAVYPYGDSVPAMATEVTMPPAPGPLTFTNITDKGFVVHWGKPGYSAKPIGYMVRYREDTAEAEVEVEVPSGEILELDVPNLDPDTKYLVEVVANYHYDIVSEPTNSTQKTAEELLPIHELTCDCNNFMTTQSHMQQTLDKLVREISRLSQKIEQLQSDGRRL